MNCCFLEGKTMKRAVDKQKALLRYYERVKIGQPDECWPCGGVPRNGYGTVTIDGWQIRMHRLAFFLFNGYWPTPMCLHRCKGNKLCCNPAHLYEGDAKMNAEDAKRDGVLASWQISGDRNGSRTHPERVARGEKHRARIREVAARGEQNGSSKLTAAQVKWARSLYASGKVTQQSLADELGVSRPAISAIVNQKNWKGV